MNSRHRACRERMRQDGRSINDAASGRVMILSARGDTTSSETRMSYCPGMSRVLERRTFWLLAAFAIAARLALLATTYGTNDAGFMAVWVDLVKRAGLAHSYAHNAMMNHPPLSVALMRIVDAIATAT